MHKYLATLLLFFSANALATDTFNSTTNILNIDAVILNGIQYKNVVVRLNAYDVLSVGSSTPVTVSETCSSNNFSVAIFNAITIGMTMSQVEQTIGCQYTPSGTSAALNFVSNGWNYTDFTVKPPVDKWIFVEFDPTDSVVTAIAGSNGTDFKSRLGF